MTGLEPNSRTAWREVWIFAVCAVVGAMLLMMLTRRVETRFDELGLGLETQAKPESWTSAAGPAVCRSMQQFKPCFPEGIESGKKQKQVLWIGYSQLYGINRYRAGDQTVPLLLRDMVGGDGVHVGAVALGNINPREILLVYEWMRQRTRIDGLIVGAWLQGTKEDGIRQDVLSALEDPVVRGRLEKLVSGPVINAQRPDAQHNAVQYGAAGQPAAAAGWSLQTTFEAAIVKRLEGTALWRAREIAEAKLSLLFRDSKSTMLVIRNALLGIKAAQWTVPVPPGRHEINVQAFADLLEEAQRDGVKVLVYVPPRPVDERFPFDPELYRAYKERIAALAKKTGAQFHNMEDAVTGDVWGKIDNSAGEIVTDFTHFTAAAHKQFADRLAPAVRSFFGEKRP